MAALSWHITVLMASLALLVTSSGAVPIASPTDIVYLDQQHQATPDQFGTPALPGRSAARHREEVLSTTATQSPSTGVVAPDSVKVSVSQGNPPKNILPGLDYDLFEVFGDIGDFESSPVVFTTPLRPSPVNVESTKASDIAVSSSLPIVFPSNTTSNGLATVEAIKPLAQQPISAPLRNETPILIHDLPDNQQFSIPQTQSEDSHTKTHSEIHITEPEPQSVESQSQLLEPGNSIPKIINRPENPVDNSNIKLQEVQPTPVFSLSNGASSHPEYIPVAPIINSILSPTNDAPAKYVASLIGTYDDPPPETYDNAPGAIFFPQDPQLTWSSYSEVPATSFAVLEPLAVPEEVHGEAPDNGFLSTLWSNGSPGQASTGLASNLWKGVTDGVTKNVAKKWEGFNKIVGKTVGKNGKKLLIKTAPIVKKIVGLKAAANLFQGAGITAAEIGGEGGLLAPAVIEYQAPSATYGAPLAGTKQVEPEAPRPIYGAPPQTPQPIYGAPPQISQPISIPTVPKQSYGAPLAVYLPESQAQQVGYFSYIPPQASHLIRNHGTHEEQSENPGINKPRQEIFGIVNKIEEGYNNAYNVFQYGRNLTNQASESLSSLWPGNWFRSTGEVAQASSPSLQSQYGAPHPTYGARPQALQLTYGDPPQAPQPSYGVPSLAPQPTYGAPPQAPQPYYGAPPQALQPTYGASPQAPQLTYGAPVLSIPATFPTPVVANPQVHADGTHVYQYPVKSASSGKEEGSSASGLSLGSILGNTKTGRLVNSFSSK